MSILVVGSIGLDHVETPFGTADEVVGGSAVFFGAAASMLAPVQVVGVVGLDYPMDRLGFLEEQGADLSGIETAEGESFRWHGRYGYDLKRLHDRFDRVGCVRAVQASYTRAFSGRT